MFIFQDRDEQICRYKALLVRLIFVTALLVFILLLFVLPPQLVGDGSEYYALTLAQQVTHLPFMTEDAWQSYTQAISSGQPGVPTDSLRNFFPKLRLGETADFNHFWFYSLIPAIIINATSKLLYLNISVHTSFLVFHFLLLMILISFCWRFFGFEGAFAVIMLVFFSPIFWFIDKVHTEFFTFCLISVAVTCVIRDKFICASVFVAIASTQNISFAATTAILGIVGIYFRSRPITLKIQEVYLIFFTVMLCFLHPIYYFFRYGAITPQIFVGGANSSPNYALMYLWLFDPDVGLLPNWPFGILLLTLSIFHYKRKLLINFSNWSRHTKLMLFLLFTYLFTNLVAQSSTQNLNSGATPGLARYATWYIPLFLPLMVALSHAMMRFHMSLNSLIVLTLSLFTLLFNIIYAHPFKGQDYNHPSLFSYFIQKYIPSIYDPPSEIFSERFSGAGEGIISNNKPIAVVGPDCRKVLIFNNYNTEVIYQKYGCLFDPERFKEFLKKKIMGIGSIHTPDLYIYLTEDEVNNLRSIPEVSRIYPFALGQANGIANLLAGWDNSEQWGTWCIGDKCRLYLACPTQLAVNQQFHLLFSLSAFITTQHPFVDTAIETGATKVWHGRINITPIDVGINLPYKLCDSNNGIEIIFLIDNPVSPKMLGLSVDQRSLGIGLISVRYSYVQGN